jgi:acyl-CoA thioester hydrolase
MTDYVNDEEIQDEDWHETVIRVRYSETDKMGVVYHANYLVWFEIGRTEFCRARGFNYRDLEEDEDAFLVVAESYCRHKSAAYFDDEVLVRTRVTELRKRTLRFGYEIIRAATGEVLAEGETGHVVTDSERRVRSLPESYTRQLTQPPNIPRPGEPERVPEGAPE